ncbi:OPT superfamily oligopeptide transporter [Hesseltinella vesiculosa]|uniref:OPT superfamily oligopeptide transporter n=1 Tax=Hesseltinella vesiculosa TaxID=101127 RepID=A0A1X2G546_9FUNG|nr:OPT superfamily oligopeptide transporter [Hesseltinella vesiculosa]
MASHFTLRAVLVGLGIGVLLCFSNMYFGLQTGWISMMSLQSSLLGYAIFKPFQPMLRTKFTPVENVVLQTVAVATGTMPLAAGFVGVLPALELLTEDDHPGGAIVLSFRQMVLWSLGVAFFGVFFAVPLRKQTIIREQLRFPSGTATAQMIQLLHEGDEPATTVRRRRSPSQEDDEAEEEEEGTPLLEDAEDQQKDHTWHLKLKALLFSFSLSSTYTLLTYFFPVINKLPIFNWLCFNLVDFQAWDWYFAPSLSYIGQGIIMGLPTTLSMLAGCIVGWGILSPMAYYTGWAPGPVDDWKTGSKGWILWVSLGVMISESVLSLVLVTVTSLAKLYRRSASFDEANQDEAEKDVPKHMQVPNWVTIVGLIGSTLLCVALVHVVFGPILPTGLALVAVGVAMVLSVLAVRALGETDLNPVSGIGKISQVAFAGLIPGGIAANLIAGGIAEAGAQQAGDLMQDLKTGHLLGAAPKAQFYGQMIGSLVSAVVASCAYLLYRTVYTIPGPEFPVPTAQVWLDMSRLVNGQPLPPHVSSFVLGFAILFAAIVLVQHFESHRPWTRYLPQGMAFAIGMYNPPSFTLARVLGGILVYVWNGICNDSIRAAWLKDSPYRVLVGPVLIIIVASGFVLGEGAFALVNMIMQACHVPHF